MTCSPTVNAAQSELPAMLLSSGHGPLREDSMVSAGEGVGRSHCDMGKTWVADYR